MPQIFMDEIDHAIITELQLDGRLTNQELAARVGLSPSPCLRRVRRLEREGIISGYAVLVDQAMYGLPLTVFTSITLSHHNTETVSGFETQIQQIEHVQDCFMMTGTSDYLLRIVAEGLEAYEALVRDKLHVIPGIATIESNFAFGGVKQIHTYPLAKSSGTATL